MKPLTQLKEAVIRHIAAAPGLEDTAVFPAFPPSTGGRALSRAVVAVGVENIELEAVGLGAAWGGALDAAPQQGPGARVTLRLDVYAPMPMGGDGLHNLWESLCAALLPGAGNPFGVQRVWCGDMAWDSGHRAWRLTARATLHGAWIDKEDGPYITQITYKHREGVSAC